MNTPDKLNERMSLVLSHHPAGDRSAMVDILHDIQAEFRYLPGEALRVAAAHLGVPASAVYEVATFYSGFHLKPRGEHVCTVCMGTACHVRGAPRILDQLERDLRIKAGQTTQDMKVTVEEVNCVGACALGPLVILDGEYHGNTTAAKVSRLVAPLVRG
ncbi:MAG: NAD(P)H-dependent oxidoreductase subunit E [Myxococcota bacterium]|jgi:NADH-quinone oxidoreductase subunit E